MVPGVLFLVPSGIAAAGGLAMTKTKQHGDSYSQGLIIIFRMVQVAIGITVCPKDPTLPRHVAQFPVG